MSALSGSRADASSPQAVSTKGFDPERKCFSCDGTGKVVALDDYSALERCIVCHGTGYACNACDPVPVSVPNAAELAEHWFTLVLRTWRDVKRAVLATGEPADAIADHLGVSSRRLRGILSGTVGNVTMRELHNMARVSGYRLRVVVEKLPASAIEAHRATTTKIGAVGDESAVAESQTPNSSGDRV